MARLAGNLRWSWHRPTQQLFEQLDPKAWADVRQDPVALLGSFTRERLRALADDRDVVARVRELDADLEQYLTEDRWYQTLGADAPASIAYFSPEYGISHVLPQYSGGLGILAGDHLKAASDLGVPLVGVGLLYAAGYFKQSLSRDAWQQETYPVLDPDGLPLTLLREPDGQPAQVTLPLPNGRRLGAYIWRADVGRVPLLLLGMGGVKALRIHQRLTGAPAPEVFHTNEGHAGFLGIERIQELAAAGLTWDEALAAGRANTVFTTHTPVPAGIDRFDKAQIQHFFSAGLAPDVPTAKILELGDENYDGGDPSKFNMAVMGLRLAQRANGVAKLHGVVSRGMFSGLWPGFDQEEVPITSVTNGVHVPTWVDPRIAEYARSTFGDEPVIARQWDRVYDVSDEDIWSLRRSLRAAQLEDVRRRLRAAWKKRGAADAELAWTDAVLDPDVLTIGFARRVPTYKRLTLMLRDPARLKALLLHPERPVQLVIAGKSHPADEQGKRMIQDLVRFTDDPEVRHRIVFLPNYDIAMARTLFPGCDVWLNNPLRPLEACGTSGMKAAINGGLNLSVLDGWWDEMYDGDNGWAIPTANPSTDAGTADLFSPDERDDIEAAALYDLIEHHVAPRFYAAEVSEGAGAAGPSQPVADDAVPHQWIAMIKHTLANLGPAVSAERMLHDYVEQLYRPAWASGRTARADDFAAAKELAAWTSRVHAAWADVSVEHVDSLGITDEPQIGESLTVNAYVRLGSLAPDSVTVQVVHGQVTENDDLAQTSSDELALGEQLGDGRYLFTGPVTIDRSGSFGYSVRVLPKHPALANHAELGLVSNATG